VSRVPLSGEETKVIFSEAALESLQRLNADDRTAVLRRLLNIVESEALPGSFVREQIANLDIIAVGDQGRLYTKIVEEIPEGDVEYHIIFLFYIDINHNYPRKALAKYSQAAEARAEAVSALDLVEGVENYLSQKDALGESDLRRLLSD